MNLDGLHINESEGILTITFNRKERKNSFTLQMMIALTEVLQAALTNSRVLLTVVTGAGDYFTSGNDLSNFTGEVPGTDASEDFSVKLKRGTDIIQNLAKALIEFSKPLIAIVNGPAIGIGVTFLAHFDYVFSSDKATFCTPFIKLGQNPELCSSYLFPRIMGPTKAAEVLLFGKKLTAEEALSCSLVSEVVPHESLASVWPKIQKWSLLPPETLQRSKAVIKDGIKSKLLEVNDKECHQLMECWQSSEFTEAISSFFNRKSKI